MRPFAIYSGSTFVRYVRSTSERAANLYAGRYPHGYADPRLAGPGHGAPDKFGFTPSTAPVVQPNGEEVLG